MDKRTNLSSYNTVYETPHYTFSLTLCMCMSRLAWFAEMLDARFRDAGFTTEAFRKPFTPHVTIWKTTKNRQLINELNASREPAAFVQNELFAFLTDNHYTAFV